ncbi:hypothetical protein PR048_028414 [Dryococelus australis]|uniref:Uncharacterized protein n=1 Tax=Dryococelus australis TaxID=614101 RepID=A0ABQ9GAG6_9NEOP|nr:hypothetical protein PR048_028414 [Dryococelus australis]
MKGRSKRETPEKTRRPAASSGTIPTCGYPVNRKGNKPGSHRREASRLTAHSPWPLNLIRASDNEDELSLANDLVNHKADRWFTSLAVYRTSEIEQTSPTNIAELEYVSGPQMTSQTLSSEHSSGNKHTEAKMCAAPKSKDLRADEVEVKCVWSSAGMRGRGKREIPEKTRQPATSSGMIMTCEYPGTDPSGNRVLCERRVV